MDQSPRKPRETIPGLARSTVNTALFFLHIRAEEQQRGAVEPVLDPRQITRVVMVGAVGTAAPSDDVAATIEHGKGMAVLERAQGGALGKRCSLLCKTAEPHPRQPSLRPAWSSS